MRSLIVFPFVLFSLIFSWLSNQLVAKRSQCFLHAAKLFFTRLFRCVVPQIILLFALSISPSAQGAVTYTSSPAVGVASSGITIWLRLDSINQATGTGNFIIGKITGAFPTAGFFYVYQNGALQGMYPYPAGTTAYSFTAVLPLGGTIFKAQRYDALVLGGLDPNVVSGNISVSATQPLPILNSVSALSGTVGQTAIVTVNGNNFPNTLTINIGGQTTGCSQLSISATQGVFSCPLSLAGNQLFEVKNDIAANGGAAFYTGTFTVNPAANTAPMVSNLAGSQASAGQPINVSFNVSDAESSSLYMVRVAYSSSLFGVYDCFQDLPAITGVANITFNGVGYGANGSAGLCRFLIPPAGSLAPIWFKVEAWDGNPTLSTTALQAPVVYGSVVYNNAVPAGIATAISPSSARLDVPLQFVINGSGFTAGSTVTVDDCPLNALPAIFSTSITFNCTPTLPGVKAVYVNNSVLPGISIDVDRPARLGNAASHRIPSVNGVSLWNGNVHLEATDLAVPGKGVSFALTRSYNSYSWSYEAGRGAVSDAAPWRFNWDLKLGYVGTNNLQLWVQREDGSGENFFKDVDGIWYPMDRNNFNTIKGDTPALGQTTLFTREGLKYVFQNPVLNGAGGLLIGIFDHDGNGLTIARDASARVATVTDASGRVYTFTYDASGHLFRVTDFSGRYVEYTWDSALLAGTRIKTVRDVLGGMTTYNYTLQTSLLTQNRPTDQMLLTSVIDPRLNTARTYTYTDSVYGNWGAATFKDGLNNTWGFSYCANQFNGTCTSNAVAARGFETVTAPPLGATTTTHFDAGGRSIEQLNANANLSRTTPTPLAGLSPRNYNLTGLPIQKQTPLGVAGGFGTNFSYTPDNLGNLASLTDATNATSTPMWSNDPVNNLPRVSQLATATGALHGFSYEGTARHVLTYTPPGLPATTFGYDAAGQVTAVTDGRNATTTQTYDANGNVTQLITPDGFVTQNTYDTLGRVLTSTDKRGGITTNTWDVAGNLISVKDALNGTVSYLYTHRL
ncbi:MAG: DUF6531 domain-containing protein [Gallionella sp.]|nr:DUF6531 domain-containing protein [Gallionella sp.]